MQLFLGALGILGGGWLLAELIRRTFARYVPDEQRVSEDWLQTPRYDKEGYRE